MLEDGSLYSWGWGGSFFHGAGALGQGHSDTVASPTRVEYFQRPGRRGPLGGAAREGLEVATVCCGAQHTLVLTREGQLYATGKGDFGRLGRGDSNDEARASGFFHIIVIDRRYCNT